LELEEIIKGCKDSDRKCQKALYELFSVKMYGVCIAYMKSKDVAQDILHDSFLKIFKHINKFNDSPHKIEGWIRRIIVNTAIDFLRREKKFTSSDFIEQYQTESYCNTAQECYVNDLHDIIGLLPDGARTVFNLYSIEGFKHKEIAEMLCITEGTSKSQVSRAKSILKALIHKHYSI
jgi:RNA polymerase sigma-70 factor (ECF subfamily)